MFRPVNENLPVINACKRCVGTGITYVKKRIRVGTLHLKKLCIKCKGESL